MLQGVPTRSGPKTRRVAPARTSRGPQGLPTQASSSQRPAKLRKPYVLPQGPRGDAPQTRTADAKKVTQYKRTNDYARSIRAAYSTLSPVERHQRVQLAKARVGTKAEHPEDRIIVREHARRLQGNANRTAAAEGFTGLSSRETRRLAAYAARNKPKVTKSHGGLLSHLPVSAGQAGLDLLSHVPGVGGAAKSVSHQISKELAGTGEFAKTLGGVAKWVGKHGVAVQTGGGPAGVAAKHYGGGTTATIVPHAVKISDNGLARRTLEDLINFPAQAPAALYVPGAAAVQSVRDRSTKPLKALGKQTVKTDPFIQLATGHPGKALKLANQHPGFAALEAIGLKGSIGRGLGHVVKAPELPARTVPGTALAEPRPRTGDVFTDTYRAKRHAAAVKKSQQLHAQADHAESAGNHVEAKQLRAKANKADPNRMTSGQIRRRIDETIAANELNRRQNVVRAKHETAQALGKNPTAAHTLAVQNIANDRAGLIQYRGRIVGEQKALSGPKLDANRELVGQIDHALKSHDPVAVETAARRYADQMNSRSQRMKDRGLLSGEAERRPLMVYAVEHMGAKVTRDKGLVDHAGSPLSNAAIQADMRSRGLGDPAFVTQAPSSRGAGNYYRNATSPPMVGRAHFTGEATIQGTHDAHPLVLEEGAAKAENLISAADGWKQAVHEVAARKPDGTLRTRTNKRGADEVARILSKPGGTEYVAIRLNPLSGSKEQLTHVLDHPHPDAAVTPHNPVQEALVDAAKGKDGPGDWAIVPKSAADQLVKHARTLGATDWQKAFQAGSQMFSRTVLATSPTWIAGNLTEAGLRGALKKAGPGSYLHANRALKRYGELHGAEAEQAARNRLTGGGHFALADRKVNRSANQFDGDTRLGKAAAGIGAAKEVPGVKHVTQRWNWYTDKIFRAVNGRFESSAQTALLGRSLKDAGLKAVDDAANGLHSTNNQVRFAREIERAYGKYNAFSPDKRWAIATYTPFVAWTINAFNFVYRVLPHDHPALTALIVASERANEDWLKARGRNQFAKGAVPGFLQTTLPIKGGKSLPIGRYTPFGAFGDLGSTLSGAVLPQLSGVLAAYRGEDWKGKKLRKANGNPADFLDQTKAAALSFAEGTVPLVGATQRVIKKGPAGALNPYAPIKPKGGGGQPDIQNPILRERASHMRQTQGNPLQQQILQERAKALGGK